MLTPKPNKKYGTIRHVAIDFDGTIAEHAKFPAIGKMKAGVREVLRDLEKHNIRIVIWTCRTGMAQKAVADWLVHHDIPFDFINTNPACPEAHEKVFADVYIDDRGYHFQNWLDTAEDLKKLGHQLPYHKIVDTKKEKKMDEPLDNLTEQEKEVAGIMEGAIAYKKTKVIDKRDDLTPEELADSRTTGNIKKPAKAPTGNCQECGGVCNNLVDIHRAGAVIATTCPKCSKYW